MKRPGSRRRKFGMLLVALTLFGFGGKHAAMGLEKMMTSDDLDRLVRPAPEHKLAYGEHPLQFGHLRLPSESAAAPFPVVMMIHGGCWLSQYDLLHLGAFEQAVAAAGYAVWSIEYRRVGDVGGGWPNTFLDVGAAADHLRELAERFPLDLNRVVVAGHSAGGQLALWLAGRGGIDKQSPLFRSSPLPVGGVLALAPAADLESLHGTKACGHVVDALMGGSPAAVPAHYDAGSPMRLLARGVPQVLVIGAHDSFWGPVGDSYFERAKKQGVEVYRIFSPDAGHFELIDPYLQPGQDVLRTLHQLFAGHYGELATAQARSVSTPSGRRSPPPSAMPAVMFDLVIEGGRVMDPESGLDAVRNLGILGGKVAALSSAPLRGHQRLDGAGLVVAPGFIDLHAHGQNGESNGYQARDGVTTALELEGGDADIDAWYAAREGKSLIHYGATVSHGGLRVEALGERVPSEQVFYEALTGEETEKLEVRLGEELAKGALGIGYGIQYFPGARREEIFRSFQVAARHGVVNFVHVRYAGQVEPGSSAEAIAEMIADSAATGAPVHVVHIGSSGLRQVPLLLEMIEGARRGGVDISTEVYPYTAASTDIRAAIFDEGWQQRLGAGYSDIEWVLTGERLDEERFRTLREEGGMIIAHIIPEEMVQAALASPGVMVASDGVPFVGGRAHPRGQGTFARVLGRYVREQGTLSLLDAVAKMSWLPARRLEGSVPQMRNKGRIRVGADADLTLFDPQRVADRATFAEPAQYSAGIRFVLVGGEFVVRDEQLVEGAVPGRAIRRFTGAR